MNGNPYTHALVRPPSASFVDAIAVVPQPIDVKLALQQHGVYVAALREAGVQVQVLEAVEDLPDACFMQDPAMIVANHAILNRMGVASRAGEVGLAADVLRQKFQTHELVAPATLEGGDVLITPGRLLVGVTNRTNTEGIRQLREIVAPLGVAVESVPVTYALHLLTVATFVGDNTLVVLEDFADAPQLENFNLITVPRQEEYAANTLGIGRFVILPVGFPKTADKLKAHGFEVLPVPMSEFYKADGGVSCLSLVW